MPGSSYKGKRILITQNRLWDFSGSEMVTLELAEFFTNKGAEVTVYCLRFGEPILSEFNRIENITLAGSSAELSFSRFDVVWVHHQVLPESMLNELIGGIDLPVVIFNHMSMIEPLEFPFIHGLEERIASLSVFNSEKTMETQKTFFQSV